MARELGGSQISALLESVPGIVNVLRSPVADAIVAMIRAGAGLENFRMDSAKELVQFAVRRGLISSGEGDRLLEEVAAAKPSKGSRRQGTQRKAKKSSSRSGGATKAKKAKKTAKKAATSKKVSKKKPAKKSPSRAGSKKKPQRRPKRR